MYAWLVLLHVLSVFGFLFTHGASAMVMFRVRAERNPERICALLDLSQAVGGAMGWTGGLLFVSGGALGFLGSWWRHGWIWTALAVFLAISIVMSWQGRLYFERLRAALSAPGPSGPKHVGESRVLIPAELVPLLQSGRPQLLAGVGLGGLAVITWLMMFRPF